MAILEIPIKGEIGKSTLELVENALTSNPNAEEIHLLIDSPGGSVFAGYSIYNALKNSGKKVKSFIQGMCGSIATLISMSAKKEDIQGNKVGHYVIHNPVTKAEGEEKDLLASAQLLQTIKKVMIDKYSQYSGIAKDEISKIMDQESSFTIEEAVIKGFVGSAVDEKLKAVARISHEDVKSLNTKDKSLLEELKTMVAEIKQGFQNIGKGQQGAKNVTGIPALLPDGTEGVLFYDAPTPAEGVAVFSDEAMSIPAAAGDYTLQDGQVITLDESGVIVAITTPDMKAEQKLKEIEAKIAKMAAKEKEMDEVKQKYEAAQAKIKDFESEVAKYQRDPIKADVSMNWNGQGHFLDGVAQGIQKKYNAA